MSLNMMWVTKCQDENTLMYLQTWAAIYRQQWRNSSPWIKQGVGDSKMNPSYYQTLQE